AMNLTTQAELLLNGLADGFIRAISFSMPLELSNQMSKAELVVFERVIHGISICHGWSRPCFLSNEPLKRCRAPSTIDPVDCSLLTSSQPHEMALSAVSPAGFVKMRAKLVLDDKFMNAIIDRIQRHSDSLFHIRNRTYPHIDIVQIFDQLNCLSLGDMQYSCQ